MLVNFGFRGIKGIPSFQQAAIENMNSSLDSERKAIGDLRELDFSPIKSLKKIKTDLTLRRYTYVC